MKKIIVITLIIIILVLVGVYFILGNRIKPIIDKTVPENKPEFVEIVDVNSFSNDDVAETSRLDFNDENRFLFYSQKLFDYGVDQYYGIEFSIKEDGTALYYVDDDGAFVTEAYATFPASLGLPNGAAQLTFNTTSKKFEYVTSPASLGNVADAITSVTDFIYPAELCYFVSSPIRVSSDESIVNTDYPKTVSTWAATDWGTK